MRKRFPVTIKWALRCVHEATLYTDNCFITLTYNNDNLPDHNSLNKSDFVKFMKRLRKKFKDRKIRYFHCGEYGEKYGRPHYHACIFNLDFYDKKIWTVRDGIPLYTSDVLDSIWQKGYCTVGDVTFESAAYVARYLLKKITGDNALLHYAVNVDASTGEIYHPNGEIITRQCEYTTMSRRPGLAKGWYENWKDDVFPSDFVVVRGKKMKPPKYYDGLYDIERPEEFNKVQIRRS